MDQLFMGATALICGVNIILAGLFFEVLTILIIGGISFVLGTILIIDYYKNMK